MDTVVKTSHGEVRGRIVEGIHTFKGIPYAAPPFGANRFQPPQPVAPWSGVRAALEYGPTVPKPPYFSPFDVLFQEPAILGEECLNLNIWSPSPGSSRLPVMVWIHGGAFANGSGAPSSYAGSRFARDGVVCITINYRLGADGFLYLGAGNANRGLLDQIAALQWVQDNITAFGGDPDNVTIFGESAGAMSIATLLSMPRATGLFRRAIAESGAGHHVISSKAGLQISHYLAKQLGVEPTWEAFAAVPIDRLLQAQIELGAAVFRNPDPALWGELVANLMPFEPTIDGEILPARPIDRIAAGAGARVDVLVGTNAEEQRLFMVPNGAIGHITAEALAGTVAAQGLPATALDTYRAARPDASSGDLFSAVITDWFYRLPAIRLAEAYVQQDAATYMYEFAWRSPQYSGQLGACHALEIAFVFDTLGEEGLEPMMGPHPPQHLADTMHAAWVAFATHGDPGWSRYTLGQRTTMLFDQSSGPVDDPHAAERILWDGLR